MIRKHYGHVVTPQDGYINISIDADPLSIDPGLAHDYIGNIVCQTLFEPLFIKDNSGKFVGGSAQNYKISSDKETYTFTLKEKNFWSDGSDVTAYDFEYTFTRLRQMKKNGSGIGLDSVISWAKATDKRTLVIQLEHPVPYLIELLTSPCFSPLPSWIIEKHDVDWTKPEHIISNGPFKLIYNQPGDEIIVEKNPYYENSSKKRLKGIRFVTCKDFELQLKKYQENEIHITCNTFFDFKDISLFKENDDFFEKPLSMLHCLLPNLKGLNSFKDPKIRKALYLAIDKHTIANSLYNGVTATTDFVPQNLLESQLNPSDFSPSLAKKLFYESKHHASLINTPIEILYADYYPNGIVLSAISKLWKEHLNIKTILHKVSLKDIPRKLQSEDFTFCYSLIPAMFGDAMAYLQNFFDPTALQDKSENYINILSQSLYANKEERDSLYQCANSILKHTLPVFPLFTANSYYLKKPFINNYTDFPCGKFAFNNLDISNPEIYHA